MAVVLEADRVGAAPRAKAWIGSIGVRVTRTPQDVRKTSMRAADLEGSRVRKCMHVAPACHGHWLNQTPLAKKVDRLDSRLPPECVKTNACSGCELKGADILPQFRVYYAVHTRCNERSDA